MNNRPSDGFHDGMGGARRKKRGPARAHGLTEVQEKLASHLVLTGGNLAESAEYAGMTVEAARGHLRCQPVLDRVLKEVGRLVVTWKQLIAKSKKLAGVTLDEALEAKPEDDGFAATRDRGLRASKMIIETVGKINPELLKETEGSQLADMGKLAAQALGVAAIAEKTDGKAN